MGPRPRDFDEELVRRSPTFRKWEALVPGAKLRYACREFVKGHNDDEERLMRRIMIARRNNVRDHQALKWARRMQSSVMANNTQTKVAADRSSQGDKVNDKAENNNKKGIENSVSGNNKISDNNYHVVNSRRETEAIISRTSHLLQGSQDQTTGRRSRRPTTLISDEAIKEEMDVHAVEATRSYKTWLSLPNGSEFLYNQKYIKGQESHDWLLKKNIWRRMRYRRENKKMVEQMLLRERGQAPMIAQPSRKRRHDETSMDRTPIDSNNHSEMDGILVNTSSPAMVVNPTMSAVPTLSARSETNRQDVVASTASEIVDHALLSTNTGVVVPSPTIVSNNTMALSIGDQQQQQQQHSSPALHHHDATESAAAFAASIALAGVGIGEDPNVDHETAVADSAAVEAAVAAALAVTDAKSNSYHLSEATHEELMEVVHEPSAAAPSPPEGLGLALDAAAKLAAATATCAPDEAVLAATTKSIIEAAVNEVDKANTVSNPATEV